MIQELTLAELGYDDRRLTVNFSSDWIYFYVPGDLAFVPGSYTRLILSHTAAQVEKPAALEVNINGHTLGTVQLTAENDTRDQIQWDIPPESLQTGRNTLKATLRTQWDPCDRSVLLPAEAVLHSEGLFHLAYEVVPREPDLALYPVPFFEAGFEPSVVYFVLPDSPAPDDLTVAATISAGLGRYSDGQIQARFVTPSELTDEIRDNHNLIVIGLPETNAFLSQLSLPLSLGQVGVADDHGILQEIASPWNPRLMVLAVMGRTYEGLFKAGAALNRQILFPGLKGSTAIIEELLDPSVSEAETPAIDKTFEDLGYDDKVVYGTRRTGQRFNFNLPASWQMFDNPSLKLLFTHSEVLSHTMSTLDVHLNDVPIGSTTLNQDNAKNGLLEVELPSWLLKGGGNRIEVFADMALGADECLFWASDQVWTVISRKSTLHLSYEALPVALDLANLFRPFSYESNLSDTYIVLPEVLDQTQRDMLLNLAARLGATVRGRYLALQVGRSNDLDSNARQAHHIVAIGQPSTNPLIREANDFLPQPFLSDSDEPAQIHNPAIITFDPQRSIGFVQLTASPWNPDKALLAVTGTDSEGVAAALDLLINSTGRLKGNLAMIEGESPITVDTHPLPVNRGSATLHVIQPDTSVLITLAERWW